MKHKKRLFAMIAGAFIVISAISASAQDWPQWRGMNRDGKVPGFKAPRTWPDALVQEWKVPVGSGDATPALVDNRLYVFTREGDNEVTRCLEAGTGKELWQDSYTAAVVTGPAGSHPGPRSSPTVLEGKIITLGVSGVLSSLDMATGKVIWRKDEYTEAVPPYFTSMSPVIVEGMCIAHLGGPDNGAIIAFDLVTGKEKWKYTGDGPAYASPVLLTVEGSKQVVVQTEKNILGLAVADGNLLWSIPTPVQRRFYNSATPVIDGQTLIFTGQGEGTRAVKIVKKGAGCEVQELWHNEELGTAYNTPVLKDGFLYGLSPQGRFFCLNTANGQAAWKDDGSHKNFGALVDAGSVILALPSDSELIAFNPDGNGYTELARYKVSDTPVYAHPVVAGKNIYVKDQESLTLFTIGR